MRPNGRCRTSSVTIHARAIRLLTIERVVGEVAMKVRVGIAVLMLGLISQSGSAAAPSPPPSPSAVRTCETDSAQQLVTCLKHCSSRVNDASTRVCKQQCMNKNDARKEQCAKTTKPRVIVLQ